MTNKQILLLNQLVTIAKSVTGINYAGLYPEAVGNIGQRFPAIIIRDGNESSPAYQTGQRVVYTYQVDCLLHVEIRRGITRIKDILDLQTAFITAVITDLTVSSLAQRVIGHEVIKGTSENVLTDSSAGYQGEISVHNIQFLFEISDTRS